MFSGQLSSRNSEGKIVQKKKLKQGDFLIACTRNDSEMYNRGTLGGFVRKKDDKRKIYCMTCNHIFPEKKKQLAYTNALNGFKIIGRCAFTTKKTLVILQQLLFRLVRYTREKS